VDLELQGLRPPEPILNKKDTGNMTTVPWLNQNSIFVEIAPQFLCQTTVFVGKVKSLNRIIYPPKK